MFSCCDPTLALEVAQPTDDQVLDLHETAGVMTALLRLLHFPPPPPIPYPSTADQEKSSTQLRTDRYEPSSIIPLPILPLLFSLADKYALSDLISQSLRTHLLAHAPAYPLQVYGFATLHDMPIVASKASQFLLPLASYTLEDVKVIPSVEAYHKIIRLQDYRTKGLRKTLLGETLFPHGYGLCPSHHQTAELLWHGAQSKLVGRIESGK